MAVRSVPAVTFLQKVHMCALHEQLEELVWLIRREEREGALMSAVSYLCQCGKLEMCRQLLERLRNDDKFVKVVTELLNLLGGSHNDDNEKNSSDDWLVPGDIVTVSRISNKFLENRFMPQYSVTNDKPGTQYLIWKIDWDNNKVYTVPLSFVKNKHMHKIPGSKSDNIPDRYAEAIVRVFDLKEIKGVVGKVEENDLDKTLRYVYSSFVFQAKGGEMPFYARSLAKFMHEKNRKRITPGFIIEYEDFSAFSGKVRAFYVWDVDDGEGIYITFELQRESTKGCKNYKVPDSFESISLSVEIHFSSVVFASGKLGRECAERAESLRNLLNTAQPGKFRVAPAGDNPGIPHGCKRLTQ